MGNSSDLTMHPKFEPGDPAAFPYMTNIDHRTCQRQVLMQVLCLGCSRTGTASLRQALIDLGCHDTYHFSAALQENPPDQLLWIEALEAKFLGRGKPFEKQDWDQLLGHCQAVTDTPCRIFYKELLKAYPDTKVILTERDDVHQWFDSMMATIVPWFQNYIEPPQNIAAWVKRAIMPRDDMFFRFNELIMNHDPGYRALMFDAKNGTETAKDWYLAYNAEIKDIIPSDKLLVMTIKEGWEPLCKFLQRAIPEQPFPRVNDKLAFMRNTHANGKTLRSVLTGRLARLGLALCMTVLAVILAMARLQQ